MGVCAVFAVLCVLHSVPVRRLAGISSVVPLAHVRGTKVVLNTLYEHFRIAIG